MLVRKEGGTAVELITLGEQIVGRISILIESFTHFTLFTQDLMAPWAPRTALLELRHHSRRLFEWLSLCFCSYLHYWVHTHTCITGYTHTLALLGTHTHLHYWVHTHTCFTRYTHTLALLGTHTHLLYSVHTHTHRSESAVCVAVGETIVAIISILLATIVSSILRWLSVVMTQCSDDSVYSILRWLSVFYSQMTRCILFTDDSVYSIHRWLSVFYSKMTQCILFTDYSDFGFRALVLTLLRIHTHVHLKVGA